MYEGQTFDLPHFGKVHTRTVYAYYDGPIMFSCESKSGQRLMAFWIDRSGASDDWLFLPVSEARQRAIEDGCISLRDALLAPESESLWQVTFSAADSYRAARLVQPSQLLPKYLPAEGSLLSDLWQPALGEQEYILPDASLTAARLAADVLDLRLFPETGGTQGVPSAVAGSVLSSLQRLVEVVAYKWEGTRAKIPQAVKREMELRVVAAQLGSLRVRLAASSNPVLLGESQVGKAVKSVIRLVETRTDMAALSEMAEELGPRALAQWKGFARIIGEDLGRLDLSWSSPSGQGANASITGREAQSTYDLLNQLTGETIETSELQGVLVGGDTKKASFHLVTFDDVDYKGTLGPGVSESALTLDRGGTALIEARYSAVGPTAEEKIEYTLLDWKEAPSMTGSSLP